MSEHTPMPIPDGRIDVEGRVETGSVAIAMRLADGVAACGRVAEMPFFLVLSDIPAPRASYPENPERKIS
ncbi:MAG: hypothetical protein JJU24_08465 [Natronohydrobacter sp.]|nr:hypothetical protein [Natronohydrobacter sp.]